MHSKCWVSVSFIVHLCINYDHNCIVLVIFVGFWILCQFGDLWPINIWFILGVTSIQFICPYLYPNHVARLSKSFSLRVFLWPRILCCRLFFFHFLHFQVKRQSKLWSLWSELSLIFLLPRPCDCPRDTSTGFTTSVYQSMTRSWTNRR